MKIGDPEDTRNFLRFNGRVVKRVAFNNNAVWIDFEDTSFIQASIANKSGVVKIAVQAYDTKQEERIDL